MVWRPVTMPFDFAICLGAILYIAAFFIKRSAGTH
jgi:hypothetical protein